ncbi:efflux RND transporter permease subunit, partial [Salmonella enterica]|uniref:efflux RND transporter permease subunit n=1 Tax=Salmonella enterica TaxID=28901 RepID=UPI003F1E202E
MLIAAAITLCGSLGFRLLPVAPLPQVEFPVIMFSASQPGASPETMASSVATPFERSLGRIAGFNEMTSSSSLGITRIILEFNFDRDIN